jgi:hypothetical protein
MPLTTMAGMKSVSILSFLPRSGGVLQVGEKPELNGLPIYSYDPLNTTGIIPLLSGIPLIFAIGNTSKIPYPVVRAVSIFVVNLIRRPLSVYDGPNNPMRFIGSVEYLTRLIAFAFSCKSRLPSESRVPCAPSALLSEKLTRSCAVNKAPRFRFIDEQVIKFDWNSGGAYQRYSHSEGTFRCGQGRALLTQRFRPAFSSRFTFRSQRLKRINARCLSLIMHKTAYSPFKRSTA